MITLWGMYQYLPSLFDNVETPEEMDKTLLIDTLMEKSGMLYIYQSPPQYFKVNVENWFKRRKNAFSRMFQALSEEYSPIENYDRFEEWKDTPDITMTSTGGHKNTLEKDGGHTNISTKTGGYTDTDTRTGGNTDTTSKSGIINEDIFRYGGHTNTMEGSNNGNHEHKVSAYNAPQTYDPQNQDTVDDTVKQTDVFEYNDENENKQTSFNDYQEVNTRFYNDDTNVKKVTYDNEKQVDDFNYMDESETETFTYQNEQRKETGTRDHKGHIHGNIGVTTAQKMISEELELRRYDLYAVICELFEKEFLIRVY